METLYIWLCVGLVLVFAEFLVPEFVIFFFGVATIIVGILQKYFPSVSLPIWIIITCLLGTVLLLLFRRFMPKSLFGTIMTDKCEKDVDNDGVIGVKVTVIETITPDKEGKVELHGSLWNASADVEIPSGQIVEIADKRNLTLLVKKIQ